MRHAVTIIQGHPDPDRARFCQALADAYAEGARSAGRDVTIIRIADLDIPYLRTQAEFEAAAIPAGIAAVLPDLPSTDHLVVIFPLWLGTMPAMLKAFLEQVVRPGLAFTYRQDGRIEKQLNGISARIVVTMGMPALAYRLFFLAHGVRSLARGILRFVGMTPVRTTYIGSVAALSHEARAGWLENMRSLGRKGI